MTDKDAPLSLGNDDFDAIQSAVMETARGRWFLAEYAKRNKAADTDKVLQAVERLEGLMQNGRIVTAPDMLQAELVTLTARLAQAKMEIVAHANTAQSHDDMVKIAVRALHKVEGRVSGIAEDLRRSATALEDPKVAAQFLLGSRALVAEGVRVETLEALPPLPSATASENNIAPLQVPQEHQPDNAVAATEKASAEEAHTIVEAKPLAISAARLSALEELANRALQMKKTHAEAQANKKNTPPPLPEKRQPAFVAEKPTAMPNVPPHADIPARTAPLMQPPEPVNDDADLVVAEHATVAGALFNPDWVVRTSIPEREEEEHMHVPQVAVAGQARSSAMLARSPAVPSSFFAAERSVERAVAAQTTPVERRSPFATLAAASKALRATQALTEKNAHSTVSDNDSEHTKNIGAALPELNAHSRSPLEKSVPNTAQKRIGRQWDEVFSSKAGSATAEQAPREAARTHETARDKNGMVANSSTRGELPTFLQKENVKQGAELSASALGSLLSIRTIDALSFEEKSVYFS